MTGLTIQERRVLIAILLALVIGAGVRYWRRQGEGTPNIQQGTLKEEVKKRIGLGS